MIEEGEAIGVDSSSQLSAEHTYERKGTKVARGRQAVLKHLRETYTAWEASTAWKSPRRELREEELWGYKGTLYQFVEDFLECACCLLLPNTLIVHLKINKIWQTLNEPAECSTPKKVKIWLPETSYQFGPSMCKYMDMMKMMEAAALVIFSHTINHWLGSQVALDEEKSFNPADGYLPRSFSCRSLPSCSRGPFSTERRQNPQREGFNQQNWS